MGTRGTLFQTPTVEVDLNRYEELIAAELKADQYKKELQRMGDYDYLIRIIEATEVEEEKIENEEEDK